MHRTTEPDCPVTFSISDAPNRPAWLLLTSRNSELGPTPGLGTRRGFLTELACATPCYIIIDGTPLNGAEKSAPRAFGKMREKSMTESMRKYIRGGLTAAFALAALPLAAAGAQAADGFDIHSS
jgi:hypothetical protein